MYRFMALFRFSLFACLLLPVILPAQDFDRWHLLKGDTSADTIQLVGIDADISVDPPLSTTRLELILHNPSPQPHDYELFFALEHAVVVNYFASDISGIMNESTPVDNRIVEAIQESRSKPEGQYAVLERVAEDVFRIYLSQIPASETRRVWIEYVSALSTDSSCSSYNLGFLIDEVVPTFTIKAEIRESQMIPVADSVLHVKDVQLVSEWQSAKLAEATFTDINLMEESYGFIVEDDPPEKATLTLVQQAEDDYYFFYRERVSLPAKIRSVPYNVLVLWDTSSVMENRDLEWELNFLKTYYRDLEHVMITLVPFADSLAPAEHFHIHNRQERRAFVKRIRGFSCSGSSNLQAIPLSDYEYDEAILFSALGNTFEDVVLQRTRYPVHVVYTLPQLNTPVGRRIASRTGGIYLTKTSCETPLDAVAALRMTYPRLVRMSVMSGRVDALTCGADVYMDETLKIAGILSLPVVDVALDFADANNEFSCMNVIISPDHPVVSHDAVVPMFAQMRLDEFRSQPGDQRDNIFALARKYGLVTEYTSLVLLEKESDNKRLGISQPNK